MLEWTSPSSMENVKFQFGIWFAGDMGYVEQLPGDVYVLRVFGTPYSTDAGTYATLEAAQAAAEVIYSTRSQS